MQLLNEKQVLYCSMIDLHSTEEGGKRRARLSIQLPKVNVCCSSSLVFSTIGALFSTVGSPFIWPKKLVYKEERERDAAFYLTRVVYYAWYRCVRERGGGARSVVMPKRKVVRAPQQESCVEFQE